MLAIGVDVGCIVIPCFNEEALIVETLDSCAAAIRYFWFWSRSARHTARIEIILVDDCSTDATVARAEAWAAASNVDCHLIRQSQNLGDAAARNAGARAGRGPLIWFLDSDDLMLPNHLVVCAEMLRLFPFAGMAKPGLVVDRPHHPSWREAAESTLPSNMCVRRFCHDFIGGFVEALRGDLNDTAYMNAIFMNFAVVRTSIQTVRHRYVPGKHPDHPGLLQPIELAAGIPEPNPQRAARRAEYHGIMARYLAELAEKAQTLVPGAPSFIDRTKGPMICYPHEKLLRKNCEIAPDRI